ncbi:MAG: hypothetical protein WBM17_03540 [Anaerolineales bacterium]
MKNFLSAIAQRLRQFPRQTAILPAELLVLSVWVLFIGREYLDFNPHIWPEGIELITNSQSHALWVAFQRCGLCFLWNGSTNGGAPSFVGILGAPLHPVVMISTLLFGFINGLKATLLISLGIAGLAQLWLGRILKLHPVVRLWCAGIAVAGGHIAGRMANGEVPIVLSIACCSLIIPALLHFLRSASRRNVVVLGLALASAVLSGHAYIQIGFTLSILPAFVLLGFLFYRPNPFPWKRLFISGGLAILLTAFFLLPLLHFLPLFQKLTDPEFSTAQPLEYLPLNLVISDLEYFTLPDLGKKEYLTYVYANYIGWLPVLLAAFACALPGKKIRKWTILFALAAFLVYLAASAWTFRLLAAINPDIAGSVRYPALIAGLAPPLILALAGLGAQAILVRSWPTYLLRLRDDARWHLRIPLRAAAAFLLAVGMVLSLAAVVGFSSNFLVAAPAYKIPEEILPLVSSPEVEWVQPPFQEYGWFPEMLDRNLKIATYLRPWNLKYRIRFDARFNILPNLPEPEVKPGWKLVQELGNYRIYLNEQAYYAVLHTAEGEIPCAAKGMWGDLEVICTSEAPGLLELKEYFYSGWQAAVDGTPAAIEETQFLSVPMPAGTHTASFRFRPWDVPVGFLISVFGWIATGVYIWRGRKETGPETIQGGILPLEPGDWKF